MLTSRRNPLVARYRQIARGRSPDRILLDGPHLVADAIAAGLALHDVVAAGDSARAAAVEPLVAELAARHIDLYTASNTVMDALSPLRSASAIVATADRPAPPSDPFAGPAPLVLVAAGVQDPGNLGAIVRVAEAGGASAVVVCGDSADPFGWKALRGSMGSALRLPIARRGQAADAVAEARRAGCQVLATAPRGGRPPAGLDLRRATAVLIGGEGTGLDAALAEAADDRLSIPMTPPVESLNAAVAAAIVVYEARRQRAG